MHFPNLLKDLFDYNNNCNERLIQSLAKLNDPPEKSIELISHILNAHSIWNGRIISEKPIYQVWQIHPVGAFYAINKKNYQDTLAILEGGLEARDVYYKNSKGVKFSNQVPDILMHIVNHSTYHRGQIATDMRRHGFEPLVTDYILYKR